MTKKETINWKKYHQTKDELIQALNIHYQSISEVNVYNNVNNTSGDYSLMNEHMSKDKIGDLIKSFNRGKPHDR